MYFTMKGYNPELKHSTIYSVKLGVLCIMLCIRNPDIFSAVILILFRKCRSSKSWFEIIRSSSRNWHIFKKLFHPEQAPLLAKKGTQTVFLMNQPLRFRTLLEIKKKITDFFFSGPGGSVSIT